MNRVIEARARLIDTLDVARKAREAGPPCSECHYRTILGNCGNPAYAEAKFEPASGTYEESYSTSVKTARSDDGLCGPEAILFEAAHIPAFIAKSVFKGLRAAWLSIAAAWLIIAFLVDLYVHLLR